MLKGPHSAISRSAGRVLAGLALAVAFAMVGCDQGGDGAGAAGGSAIDVKVDKSFWHRGFKVTLGSATVLSAHPGDATLFDAQPAVAIEATFQNLGTEAWAFPSEMVLSSGGKHYTEAAPQQNLPKVPGQTSQSGTIAFVVDEQFQLGEAVLTVGAPDERQAVLPLARPEGLISLQPRLFEVTGKASASPTFYATVERGELRADNPDWHSEADAGHAYVWLHFTVTNDSPGMLAVLYGNSNRLRLPDGSSVGIAVTCGRPQLHPGPHATARGGLACFEVPTPAAGEYIYAISGDDAEGLEFTIV